MEMEGIGVKVEVIKPERGEMSESDGEDKMESDDDRQGKRHSQTAEKLKKEMMLKCTDPLCKKTSQPRVRVRKTLPKATNLVDPTLTSLIKQEPPSMTDDDAHPALHEGVYVTPAISVIKMEPPSKVEVEDEDDNDSTEYEEMCVTPDLSAFKTEANDNGDLPRGRIQPSSRILKRKTRAESRPRILTTKIKQDQSDASALEGNQQQPKPYSWSSYRPNALKCTFCHEVFDDSREKRSHYTKHHHSRQPVTCQHCNIQFQRTSDKNKHVRYGRCRGLKVASHVSKKSPQSMGGIWQPATSNSSSDVVNAKEEEVGLPQTELDFPCEFCGDSFATKNGLIVHVARVHPTLSNKQRGFDCPVCQMSFVNKYVLRQHQKAAHNLLGKFPCKYCRRSFSSVDDLQNHETLMCKSNPSTQASQDHNASHSSSSSSTIFVGAESLVTSSQPVASSSNPRKDILNTRNHFTNDDGDLGDHNDASSSSPVAVDYFDYHDQFQQLEEEEEEQPENMLLDPLA